MISNFQLALTVGLALAVQPVFVMTYFWLDKLSGDLQRTAERPITVSRSLMMSDYTQLDDSSSDSMSSGYSVLLFLPQTYIPSGIYDFST